MPVGLHENAVRPALAGTTAWVRKRRGGDAGGDREQRRAEVRPRGDQVRGADPAVAVEVEGVGAVEPAGAERCAGGEVVLGVDAQRRGAGVADEVAEIEDIR